MKYELGLQAGGCVQSEKISPSRKDASSWAFEVCMGDPMVMSSNEDLEDTL